MEFTRSGYRLDFIKQDGSPTGLLFRLFAQTASWRDESGGRVLQMQEWILADLQVWFPCTLASVLDTLKTWLSMYQDADLIENVDSVVLKAFEEIPRTLSESRPRKVTN